MVNSGSSANLLAVFAAGNLMRKNRIKPGDEVILPILCWPTSLWPLVQFGLKPIFVDNKYLVRLGPQRDGGYVIDKRIINKIDYNDYYNSYYCSILSFWKSYTTHFSWS